MTSKAFTRQLMKQRRKQMTKDDGYWCVICQRFIEADEDGLIVHDDITHPNNMTFDDEERPQ